MAQADDLRDLKLNPLTISEVIALKAASSLATEIGQAVSEECVNASFEAGQLPVHVQFFVKPEGDEAAFCIDPHFSIRVHFSDNETITEMEILDN